MCPERDQQNVLEREVRFLKGVGPQRAELLGRLGIKSVRDLLLYLPRDYEDRRRVSRICELKPGEPALISGRIAGVNLRRTRGGPIRTILEVSVSDGTGLLVLVWFNATHGWLGSFPEGETITAYGRLREYQGLQMVAPDCAVGSTPERSGKFGAILPLYPLTEGLSQRVMRRLVRGALEAAAAAVPDPLPVRLRIGKDMPGVTEALWHVHFPPDLEAARAARRRLSYEELLAFQCALAIHRTTIRSKPGFSFKVGPNVDRRIRSLFPFTFTAAQSRAVEQVAADMRSERPMNRLLQGDVGCGKTAVAIYALLAALAESSKGYQAALMAPTQVLAEQHYLTLGSLLERARVRTMLLSASSPERDRARQLSAIARGEVDLVVGTQALIERDVEFKRLALVVIDEQHRFGVRQRLSLRRKGPRPDVLIMTATPIPRTLALACFGDMDVSVIDEMPPGRKEVKTSILPPARWHEAFEAALWELRRGRQVFVVYPLVEESESLDISSAKEGYEELSRGAFRGFDCCLLHGQMPPHEKRRIMEEFRDGRYHVMVATTVIEVGIDVPQATMMIIQHAERLGLAQLHQLRGRVGRGTEGGRCFLLAEPTTEEAEKRLQVLERTNDGFEIAETDLRIRGPGQFFGTEQSGLPEFRCYEFADTRLLEEARADAFAIVESDPELGRPQHALLRQAVRERYAGRFTLAGVG